MTDVWITIAALAVVTALIKAAGPVLLGGREVPVVELLAEILRAVARAATEAVGFLPAAVLTYPAAWGNPRRQTLQDAAARAGWHQIRLVPEPVAAARYFTNVMRRPVNVRLALAPREVE